MARHNFRLLNDLTARLRTLPWWVGVVLAVVTYLALHALAVGTVTAPAAPGTLGKFVGEQFLRRFAGVAQYVVPAIILFGAALSAAGQLQRRALHRRVAGSPHRGALNAMSWRQFETLVGEAFRRQGYAVAETGRAGADGGYDLVLKKAGATFLVQCKQWRAVQLGVTTVRELYGVVAAIGATGGIVVTSGRFTDDARAFAAGQNLRLIDGDALHTLIGTIKLAEPAPWDPLNVRTTGAPFCPVCQSRMVIRRATRGTHAGKDFWGCSRYPACTGKRRI